MIHFHIPDLSCEKCYKTMFEEGFLIWKGCIEISLTQQIFFIGFVFLFGR